MEEALLDANKEVTGRSKKRLQDDLERVNNSFENLLKLNYFGTKIN